MSRRKVSCYNTHIMIKPQITQLNRYEVLRYLGLHSNSPVLSGNGADDMRLQEQIARCERTVLETARIRCVYQILPLERIAFDSTPDTDSRQDTAILFHGKDIARLLDGCSEVVLMALTLGAELERVLMRQEVTDMSDALVLDICASVAVEAAADDFEKQLSAELLADGKYLTNRFSPGYGDLPLSHQRPLLELLNASRAAGITLTPSQLMVPRKSVTAILGICDHMKEKTLGGCSLCPLKTKCSYRSHNLRCYE